MAGVEPSLPLPRATALRVVLAVATVHGLAYALSEFSGAYADKPRWQQLYEAFAFLPLQLASMLALLRAAGRTDLPEGTRRGLRAIAFGFGALVAGSSIWFIMDLRGEPLGYISWADLVYFQFYPGLIIGLRSLPATEKSRDATRDWLGWVVVLLAFGALIAFSLQLEARTGTTSTGVRLITLLTSAAQLATLMAINGAVERARRIPSRPAAGLLIGALALSVLGDLIFQIVFSTGYSGDNWNVVAAVATNVLIVYAAIRFLEDPLPDPATDSAPRIPFSPLPIIAVSALAMLLVWMAGHGSAAGTGSLMLGLVALNVMLVVRDVLASRTAAEAMQAVAQREATARIEALVRHASDAIILLDGEGRVLFASAPADRLFGAALTTSEGRPFEQELPPEEREAWRALFAELRAHPGQPATHTWRIARASGDAHLVESIGLDLRAEPAVRGIVLNSRDVTERALLEARLGQAQKLEVAGRLAGGVAHDFNNVLTAVIAGTELAQMSLEPDHVAQEDLAGIAAAAQRGAALTRRLLAFVRQEPVPAQRFDLEQMLVELEPLLQRLAGDSNIISARVAADLGTVHVDRTELEHIIFNLVANARDAMPEGGPIEIIAEAVEVDTKAGGPDIVIAPPPGRHVCLTVADRGHGMSDEVRRRMFDPFFTQKTGGRGTGLGLIGVRPLVEGAKGGLRVESSPDRGTRISLYLPLEAPVTARAPRAPRVSGQRRAFAPTYNPKADAIGRILLVEDEVAVRDQLTRLLNMLGYAAVAVPSAADARAVLGVDPGAVDAVVSDVMMPGETGLEFAAWLRERHPALPVLLISGHTGAALDREARISEELDLLRKPFSSAELAARLAKILRRD